MSGQNGIASFEQNGKIPYGQAGPPPLHILVVGLNHKTAPLAVRERVSFSKDQLPGALSRLIEEAGKCVIVSTCNRTEIYTVTLNPTRCAGDVQCRDSVRCRNRDCDCQAILGTQLPFSDFFPK